MEEEGKKPNLSGLHLRAFVSDSDTHLGRALCRTLTKKGDYDVWGTSRDPLATETPQWVKKLVERGTADKLKNVLLESDLIVYELSDTVEDATVALKLLMNAHTETEKTFILVSSVQTWAATRTERPEEEEMEGEEDEEDESVQQEEMTEDTYNRRIPHVKYTAWKEVEKLCKQANSATLHTYVIFAGLLYGEGEDHLHPLLKQAWHLSPEGLPIFGTGKNVVPMIHAQDLATFVYRLASREEPEDQRYFFGVDEGNCTWNSIVKATNDTLGNGKTYKVPERDYVLYEKVEHSIINLKVEPTGIKAIMEDEEDWVCPEGFVAGIERVVSEFKMGRKLQPLRIMVVGPPGSGKTYFSRQLADKYRLPHISVMDVITEFQAQEAELKDELTKIKQRRKDERRRQRMEERWRAKAEAESAKGEGEDDDDDEKDEDEAEEREEEPEEDMEDDVDDEEDEAEDEEDDEQSERIKERLAEVSLILEMKVKPKGPKPEDEEKEKAKQRKGGQRANMKNKLKKEVTPPGTPPEEASRPPPPPRYTDKCLAMMFRWKLAQPACRNQGWVLDGYPKTVTQARLLLEEGELEAPEEGAEEEEEELEGQGEEMELRKVEDKLLADYVLNLVSSDTFLTERLMHVTEQAEHNNPLDFQRRLDFYKLHHQHATGLTAYLESVLSNADEIREVSVRDFLVDTCPLVPPPPPQSPLEEVPIQPVFQEMTAFVGEPHNYGPTPRDIEDEQQLHIRREEERVRLQQEEESVRRARDEEDQRALEHVRKREEERLATIQHQEREMLEVRKEPLKRYLMENVIPILTKGLIDVCEVRPEDPIDYLAEWLFRHNPSADV